MTTNAVLFAAGGVLVGLIVAQLIGAGSFASKIGLAA